MIANMYGPVGNYYNFINNLFWEFENFIPFSKQQCKNTCLFDLFKRVEGTIQVCWLILVYFTIWSNMLSLQQEKPWPCVGDPAYLLRVHLQVPYRVAGIRPQMEVYNKAMSAVRMSVEWLFGDIVNYFKFLDFKKNLKISLSAVGKMYIVCAILRNGLTCMYSNLTSEYFAVDPPTIQDYFA